MVPYNPNTERDVKHHNDIISTGYCSSRKMCSFMNRWSEFSGLSDLWSVFAVCFFSDTNHHCLQSEGEVVFAVKKDTDSVYISLILKLTTRFGFSYFPTKMLLSTPSSSDFVQPKSHITQEKNHRCSLVHYHPECTCLYFALWNVNLLRFTSFSSTFCVHATSNYCITFSWEAALTFAWDSAQPSSDILSRGTVISLYISRSPFYLIQI